MEIMDVLDVLTDCYFIAEKLKLFKTNNNISSRRVHGSCKKHHQSFLALNQGLIHKLHNA